MGSDSRHAVLESANGAFHDAYSAARDGVRDQVPIMVVLPTELALHHQGQRHLVPYSCPAFTATKSAAHIAVALFALTCAEVDPVPSRAGVAHLLGRIAAALDTEPGSDALQTEIAALLEHCQRFGQSAREQLPPEHSRAAFASEAGPRILHITELATRAQVAGLHEAAEQLLVKLVPEEQAALQVVVIGDHQARARSLGMQYFKRRLQEQPGVDVRVTYGENIADEQEAISLVATRRLDKQIARDFFGDETRLQRDVLGDAAKRCIDRMSFPDPAS